MVDRIMPVTDEMVEKMAQYLLWAYEQLRTLDAARSEAREMLEIAHGIAPVPTSAADLWARMEEPG